MRLWNYMTVKRDLMNMRSLFQSIVFIEFWQKCIEDIYIYKNFDHTEKVI